MSDSTKSNKGFYITLENIIDEFPCGTLEEAKTFCRQYQKEHGSEGGIIHIRNDALQEFK